MSIKEKLILIKRDKRNSIIICLMIICSTIAMFSLSYMLSIKQFWNTWTENSYDFRLYYISNNDENTDKNVLIESLKNNKNIEDVFSYLEFMSFGTIDEFKTDDTNGQINIIGTIPNTKKIKLGQDLSEKDFEIICPSNLFPNTMMSTSEYDSKREINIDSRINDEIIISIFSDSDNSEKFKLVGTYDEKYDFSDSNICYTTHSTIKKINSKYQPDLKESGDIYFLLSKNGKITDIGKIEGIDEVIKVKELKKNIGDEVINVSILSIIIMFITIYIFIYLITINKLKNNYKKYGIMRALGYSTGDIRNLLYTEIIYLIFFSQIIAIFITKFTTILYPKIFFSNDMQLSKLIIKIPTKILIVNIILSSVFIFIANNKNISFLKKMNIKEIMEQ